MHKEIVDFLNSKVAGCEATVNEPENLGDPTVSVKAEKIKDVCFALRDSDYEFNVLQVISGVDFEDRIEVCYIIASFTKNHELILKASLAKANPTDVPSIDTVVDVWKSANFLEREVHDMNGVDFVGHPDLRRLLCPEDWIGYPLRKDYVVQEVYNGMVVNPEHKINQGDFDFQTKLKLEAAEPKKISGSWKGHVSSELEEALERKLAAAKSE
jgi:NADH-quinone oxidoreductase subunit C